LKFEDHKSIEKNAGNVKARVMERIEASLEYLYGNFANRRKEAIATFYYSPFCFGLL